MYSVPQAEDSNDGVFFSRRHFRFPGTQCFATVMQMMVFVTVDLFFTPLRQVYSYGRELETEAKV